MPGFAYSARVAGSGATDQGRLDAPTRQEAARMLQARGLQVLRLEEEGAPARGAPPEPAAGEIRLAAREQLPFLEALSDLVHAGMSAGEAVRLLAMRLQEPRLRALCAALWGRLGGGSTLSAAMGGHPEVFDRQTVNLVAAGEATGNLREVLARLIRHFTERR